MYNAYTYYKIFFSLMYCPVFITREILHLKCTDFVSEHSDHLPPLLIISTVTKAF